MPMPKNWTTGQKKLFKWYDKTTKRMMKVGKVELTEKEDRELSRLKAEMTDAEYNEVTDVIAHATCGSLKESTAEALSGEDGHTPRQVAHQG